MLSVKLISFKVTQSRFVLRVGGKSVHQDNMEGCKSKFPTSHHPRVMVLSVEHISLS